MVRQKLRINSSKLIEVILGVADKSCKHLSEKSSSYDFDLAIPYLKEQKLEGHICFRKSERNFPLNSERKTYDYLNNIIIRNLEIDLELNPEWKHLADLEFASGMKWHFESCHIKPKSSNSGDIVLPWRSSFRFYKNIFEFPGQGMRTWLLSFGIGSRVLFQKNNFKFSDIQITDSFHEKDTSLKKVKVDEFKHTRAYYLEDDAYKEAIIRKEHGLPDTVKIVIPDSHSRHIGIGAITFLGNKGINSLLLRCEAGDYVFNGQNQINSLRFNTLNYKNTGVNFYFSSREKIDPKFNHVFHHRALFLEIRDIAGQKNDSLLVNALDKHLDRIQYFIVRHQDVSLKIDGKYWFVYWQDRILFEWRRLSSDFYRSWFRPLSIGVLGYVTLNAVPSFFFDSFSFYEWMEFSLRPINQIPFYVEGLESIFGKIIEEVPAKEKLILRSVGLLQVIWVAIWAFAFAKSIKRS